MWVVTTAPGAVVHEGFQKVDSSYMPRSAVKACRTGGGMSGVKLLRVSRSPSGPVIRRFSRMSSRVPVIFSRAAPRRTKLAWE